MNEQKITPDYYPQDSSQVLAWHERRHEAVHEILTGAGIKGSLTLLVEQRVEQLASSRLKAIAEVQKLTTELEKLRADHDALGNDMDAVCVERDEARKKLKQALEVNAELRVDEARLVKERDEARALCGEANRHRDKWRKRCEIAEARIHETDNSDLEPSRLEIAARIMQGWAANPSMESITSDPIYRPINAALEIADALIAAANNHA